MTFHQSAFVGGRHIQDNLVVAQEVCHALKDRSRGGKDCTAIKLDMNKAYDRLEWPFLQKVLLALGFCRKWVDWIMALVTSVTYQYKVNGKLSEKVTPHRGLRQGDPLSPYLFILVVDTLSHLLIKAKEEGSLRGISLALGAPSLTHLFFADDAVLFSKAKEDEAYQLISILNRYSRASG